MPYIDIERKFQGGFAFDGDGQCCSGTVNGTSGSDLFPSCTAEELTSRPYAEDCSDGEVGA